MKKIKYLLMTIILLGLSYCIISYLVIIICSNGNGNFVEKHYFKYKNIEEAKERNGIIKDNLPFELVGFTTEQVKLIRQNIFIYTTKSNYQMFYGFWINIKSEDKEMFRLNLEVKDDKSFNLLPNAQIHIDNYNYGWLYGSSVNLSRNKKLITLDVIEFQNNKPVKLGEIIIQSE